MKIVEYTPSKYVTLNLVHQIDHNNAVVKFDGIVQSDENNVVYFILGTDKKSFKVPLKDMSFKVTSPMTDVSGMLKGQIREYAPDGSFIDNLTDIFPVLIRDSIDGDIIEITDPRIDLWFDAMQKLYNEVKDEYESGALNGKDGVGIKSIEKTKSEGLVDTYTITLTNDSTFVYSVTNGRDGIDGKSAYELAVKNGYQGTEEEWLESLRYDHSDEFKQLADQVKLDAKSAEDSATKAESAMNEANTTAQENVEAINKASTNAQNAITTSKDSAVKAVQDTKSTAEEAISDKQTKAVQAVDTAKTSATQAIIELKESAVSAITQEKTSATEAIETGKTNALTDIETAKDNAIEEIENTGVPLEDIEKLAIKETTQGNPTVISDSADWRLQDLKVCGQSEQDSTTGAQLFDILKATPMTNTFGLTVTIDGDYILINGSVENLMRKDFRIINTDVSFEGKICKAFDVTTTNCSIVNLVPSVGESNIVIHLNVTALENISCKFKLMVSDTEPISYEPYTGGKPSPSPDYPQEIISKEVSEIKVTGKNLANIQEFEKVYDGKTFEAHYEDDKITYSGADDWSGCSIVLNQTFEAGQYMIHAKGVVMIISDIALPNFEYNEYWDGKGYPYFYKFTQLNQKISFNSDIPFKIGFIGGDINTEKSTVSGTMEQIQIELSSEATSYEQHKEQTITLSEPITLRGIPVSSDGNVTIDGQQYISDVITEKDGVIGVEGNTKAFSLAIADMNNSEDFPGWKGTDEINEICNAIAIAGNSSYQSIGMSSVYRTSLLVNSIFNALFYDEKNVGAQSELKENYPSLVIDYVCALITPTFEPLPEEVQAQYKALKSYYPNTVIQTGCWNEVEYVADTKMYIEKKLSEISSQLTELKADTLLLGGM